MERNIRVDISYSLHGQFGQDDKLDHELNAAAETRGIEATDSGAGLGMRDLGYETDKAGDALVSFIHAALLRLEQQQRDEWEITISNITEEEK